MSKAVSKAARFCLRKDQATFPLQFLATGTHCGIKKQPDNLDLALIVSSSSHPTSAAACFTKNAFQAAPVQVSKAVLAQSPYAKAIVTNSGCANAVTGSKGLENAWAMSKAVDQALKVRGSESEASQDTLVMSTGVIGQHLPMHRILPAITASCIPTLSSSFESWEAAAKAFMTTDTFPKLRTRQFSIPGRSKPARFVGIDKGAGMIHPRMGPPHATLLGLVATDAAVSPAALQTALTHAVDRSFNSISIDGDTSTNDTIVALANGAAWDGKDIIEEGSTGFAEFQEELTLFLTGLAKLIVWDGEGATKFITISVEECPSYEIAHQIASTLSTSMLLKCAINGADANWGRVLCAVGYSNPDGFSVDPSKVSVTFRDADGQELQLLVNGEPRADFDEALGKNMLEKDEVFIHVTMGSGEHSASYYTCDLSKEYVSINGDYRS